MPILNNKARYDSGGSVTLTASGTNRCLVIIPTSRTGGTTSALTVTVGGISATQKASLFNGLYGVRAQAGVFYILDANYPAAGAHAVINTWSDGALDNIGTILEFSDINQSDPLSDIASANISNQASPVSHSVTLANQSGKFGIAVGLWGCGSFGNDSGFINSVDGHTKEIDTLIAATTDNARQVVFSDAVIASNSETYNLQYSLRGSTLTIDSMISLAFAVNAPATNQDPQLDTPQPDVTIQEGQTGTIQAGANFSDANGDTLTFSISPNINPVQGFTFNTSTGAIIYDGSQVAAGAISYTVTADDGEFQTQDTFTIEVIAPVFTIDSVSDSTPDAGSTVTINVSNEAAAVTASCSAGAMTGTYSSGQFVLNVPNPPDFGDKTLTFNQAITVTLSDGTNTDTLSIQIQVPSGELFAEITEIDPDGIYANDTGLVVGDFAHFKNITGDIVIDPATGLYSVNPSSNVSFQYSLYDVSVGDWSDAYETVSFTAETVPPVIILNGANPLVHVQGIAWSDPGAMVTDNVDATRQINAGSTPNINAVGSYVLTYNATDAAGNAATPVNRTVNVVSADITPNQFNFTDVNNAELNTLYENTQPIVNVDAGQTVTATNGQVSNDNGATWASSVQMVTGQTLVKASITTSGTNSLEHTVTVTVNGISDTFSVTTKAAVTLSYTTPSQDALVSQSSGSVLNAVIPIVTAWDGDPEYGGTLIDSWTNVSVASGIATISGSSVQPATDYLLIFRAPGLVPTGYYRTIGQFS